MVFFERQHTERDEFNNRKLVPREENRLSRGVVADCQNHVGVGRAHFFCSGAVRDVRGLRLQRIDLQFANCLLFFRDDLLIVGVGLAYKFVDSFPARRWSICRHDFAIRLLGHADFLEFENDTGAISIRLETQSRVLSG